MGWRSVRRAWFYLFVLLFAPICWSDLIDLPYNMQLPGLVEAQTEEGVHVRLLNGGKVILNASLVRRIEREPLAMFHVRRGDWRLGRGEEAQAEAAYREALTADPEFTLAQEKLSNLLLSQRLRAIDEMTARAERHLTAGEYEQAIRIYIQALAKSPTDESTSDLNRRLAVAYARLAFRYYDHCWNQGALAELDKAAAVNPSCAEVYYVLGRVYQDDGSLEQAQANYERALDLDPTHMPARSQLVVLQNQKRLATPAVSSVR